MGKYGSQNRSRRETRFINHVSFKGPFPESTNFTIELPPGLKDDAGRSLINADKFPLSVRTDKYPPLAKFSARFGILELKAEPMLPVTLRSLEPEVKARMKKVDQEEGIVGKVTGKILNVSSGERGRRSDLVKKGSFCLQGKLHFGP